MFVQKAGTDKCQHHLSNAQTRVYSRCRRLTTAVLCLSPTLQRGSQKPALCVVWQSLHCSHYHSQNSHPTIKLYSFHLFLNMTRLMQSCWVRACVCPSMYLPETSEHLPDFDHCWQKVRDLDNTKLMKVVKKMSTWSEIRKTCLHSQNRKSLPAHIWTLKDPTWVARPRETRPCQCCKHHVEASQHSSERHHKLWPSTRYPGPKGLNSPWSMQLPPSSFYSKERETPTFPSISLLMTSTGQLSPERFMPNNSHGSQGTSDLAGANRNFSFRRKQSWMRRTCQGEKITKKINGEESVRGYFLADISWGK